MPAKLNPELENKYKLTADTIRSYPLQIKESWDSIKSSYFPESYKKVDNVILCGMGGSALGGRIVDSLVSDNIRVPFEIFTDYHIPNYANEKTLLISSSYSGTTEETISCTFEGLNKKCKIFGITTGNKLAEILKKEKLPSFIIDEKYNPSKQPRMSIGYASGSILALFSKLGLAHISDDEIDKTINVMNNSLTEFHENISEKNNLSKIFVNKLKGKVPILIASEHLLGTSHTIKNQFNENTKTFSCLFDIPELNHHLMEGLKNPTSIRNILVFLFIESELYSDRVRKRYKITEDVVGQNGFEYHVYIPGSNLKITQAFETLIFGSFLTYYLSKLYSIDPTVIPWVDYFKNKLGQPLGK